MARAYVVTWTKREAEDFYQPDLKPLDIAAEVKRGVRFPCYGTPDEAHDSNLSGDYEHLETPWF